MPVRGLLETILQIDHWIFAQINHEWTNSFFDWFFPAITDLHKNPWCLAIVFALLSLWVWKCRWVAFRWILILALSAGLADAVSYRLIKPIVNRSRPPASGITVQLRSHHHSGMSFPSNHATNIFAAATVLSSAFPPLSIFFYFGAFLIAYSRVYVGVHFPTDVFAGALLGIAVATFVRKSVEFVEKKRGKSTVRID